MQQLVIGPRFRLAARLFHDSCCCFFAPQIPQAPCQKHVILQKWGMTAQGCPLVANLVVTAAGASADVSQMQDPCNGLREDCWWEKPTAVSLLFPGWCHAVVVAGHYPCCLMHRGHLAWRKLRYSALHQHCWTEAAVLLGPWHEASSMRAQMSAGHQLLTVADAVMILAKAAMIAAKAAMISKKAVMVPARTEADLQTDPR